MRTMLLVTATVAGLALGAPPKAHAIGCLSGGAAGALAGHMAGHGILGAIGGCIAGHAWHKHQERMETQDYLDSQRYEQRRHSIDPDYRSPWSQ